MNWHTRITETFNIKYPIVQGGLAHLAYAELASAVSNAGGLGQITAMSLQSPDDLRHGIHKVRDVTDKLFGVHLAISASRLPFEEVVKDAVEKLVSATAGTDENRKVVLD